MPANERPSERRSLELENDGADRVADRGYRVHQNPTKQQIAKALLDTGDVVDPKRSPDYLVEGHVFDCYAPAPTTSVRAVGSAVTRKIKDAQTQRVVLNLKDWRGNLAALQKQFADWPVPALKELVAVTRNGTIVQIVRRD
ncbi:hypothetical protein AB0D32_24305 [Micromonospora sp. NPDC048170]|uniref:CdiA C-terminal domain-containing protein n=1 Tax=Micromonospora sp. NPDC048170 TaxID=3154819 RepID=UPI003411A90B